MTTSGQPHETGLTVEEALGVLDIMLVSPMELTSHQSKAMQKLSEFCRRRLCAEEPLQATESTGSARRATLIYRLLCGTVKLERQE